MENSGGGGRSRDRGWCLCCHARRVLSSPTVGGCSGYFGNHGPGHRGRSTLMGISPRLRVRIGAFVLIASIAFADEIHFAGIVAGFVFDASSSSIRPILGVPGAAMLGSPVAQDINAAEIAPGGDRAVVSKGGRLHLISGFPSGSPAWTPISGIS